MDIKTKFNIGDTAYFLNENRTVVECKVIKIAVAISQCWSPAGNYSFQDLEYLIKYYDCEELTESVKAGKLFATPELLFENLKNNILRYEPQTE